MERASGDRGTLHPERLLNSNAPPLTLKCHTCLEVSPPPTQIIFLRLGPILPEPFSYVINSKFNKGSSVQSQNHLLSKSNWLAYYCCHPNPQGSLKIAEDQAPRWLHQLSPQLLVLDWVIISWVVGSSLASGSSFSGESAGESLFLRSHCPPPHTCFLWNKSILKKKNISEENTSQHHPPSSSLIPGMPRRQQLPISGAPHQFTACLPKSSFQGACLPFSTPRSLSVSTSVLFRLPPVDKLVTCTSVIRCSHYPKKPSLSFQSHTFVSTPATKKNKASDF